MPQLPALRYSNALVDFSPVSNALDANRKNALEQRDSARQDEMLGLRRQELDYNRQRTDKADARAQIERGAQMASAIGSMSDNDPAKQAAWKRYLSEYGDGDHTPEELDFRTGPKIAAAAAGKFLDPRDSQMKDLELQKTRAEIGLLGARGEKARTGPGSMTPAETAVDKAYAKSYERDVVSGGLADSEKNIRQLRSVKGQLEDPNGSNLTGPILGRLPDAVTSFTNPKAVNAREQVEEVVQRNLRLILGAQFTQNEGFALIKRAYNPTLDEATNAKRLGNLLTAMQQAINSKKAAAAYYETHGTLKGFQGKVDFTVSDFENAIEAGGSAPQAPQQGQSKLPDPLGIR